MSRESLKARQRKREKMVAKYADKRAASRLRATTVNPEAPQEC